MDSEEVKILILEKLFSDTIPKLISLTNFLNYNRNNWYFNAKERLENGSFEQYFDFNFTIDEENNFSNCTVRIVVKPMNLIRKARESGFSSMGDTEFAQLIAEAEERNAQALIAKLTELKDIEINFTDKNLAIKTICEHLNLKTIMNLGLKATKDIDFLEDENNLSVGTLRKILGISKETDINNLETRKLLIEFSK